MHKKTFLILSLLLNENIFCVSAHITTVGQSAGASSHLIAILQDLSSVLTSSTNTAALSTILSQVNSGVTVFDIQILEQALQEALPILTAAGGLLTPLKIIEYTGVLIETIAQLEAARVHAASATSLVVTTTHS